MSLCVKVLDSIDRFWLYCYVQHKLRGHAKFGDILCVFKYIAPRQFVIPFALLAGVTSYVSGQAYLHFNGRIASSDVLTQQNYVLCVRTGQ